MPSPVKFKSRIAGASSKDCIELALMLGPILRIWAEHVEA